MKMIEVKCVQPYFDDVWNGLKDFECRFDDRNYEVGDLLWQREYIEGKYTERSVVQVIISKVNDAYPGLTKGYCLLGVKTLCLKHGQETAIP